MTGPCAWPLAAAQQVCGFAARRPVQIKDYWGYRDSVVLKRFASGAVWVLSLTASCRALHHGEQRNCCSHTAAACCCHRRLPHCCHRRLPLPGCTADAHWRLDMAACSYCVLQSPTTCGKKYLVSRLLPGLTAVRWHKCHQASFAATAAAAAPVMIATAAAAAMPMAAILAQLAAAAAAVTADKAAAGTIW